MLESQRTVSCLRPRHDPHSPGTNHILQKDQLSSLSVSPCSQLPQSVFFGYETVLRLLRTLNNGSSRAHSHRPWRRISPGSRGAESQERSLQDPLSISLLKQKGEECGRDLRTTPPLLRELPWGSRPRAAIWVGMGWGEEYHKMGFLERQRRGVGGSNEMSPKRHCRLPPLAPVWYPSPARHRTAGARLEAGGGPPRYPSLRHSAPVDHVRAYPVLVRPN